MRTRAVAAVLAVAGLVLAACGEAAPDGSGGGSPGLAEGLEAFDSTSWQLTSATVDGSGLELFEQYPITLALGDDGLTGMSACNHYFGTISEDDGALHVGGLGGTDMGCPDGGVMELEAAYLAALGRVTAAARAGDTLTLTGDDVELVYERVPPEPDADLVGTTWVLDTLLDGDTPSSTASSTTGERQSTLTIAGDGGFTGHSGCNSFGGRAEVAGGRFEVESLESTLIGCEGLLGEQETHVYDVLGGSPRIEIEGRSLTLTLDGGRGLVYRADR